MRSWLRTALFLIAACGLVPLAHAQSEDDLLPVEQAFQLSARMRRAIGTKVGMMNCR